MQVLILMTEIKKRLRKTIAVKKVFHVAVWINLENGLLLTKPSF